MKLICRIIKYGEFPYLHVIACEILNDVILLMVYVITCNFPPSTATLTSNAIFNSRFAKLLKINAHIFLIKTYSHFKTYHSAINICMVFIYALYASRYQIT